MPGSPQAQGQTDQPGIPLLRGKEKSEAEGNPERQRERKERETSLFSIGWWLSVLQSQGFLNWFSFFLLLLFSLI